MTLPLHLHPIPSKPYGDFSLDVHRSAGADRVIKAQMELTYRCNLHCRHCYTDPYNHRAFLPKEMTFEEVTRILDEMADVGILWLNFTGGEVLARRDFFDIYDYAYAKGFLLVLYTNGTMLTESVIARLTQQPPFYIDVSCHSATEERFDWFTQIQGSYRQFVAGLERLKASGLPFRMKSLAMNWNQEEWARMRLFVESFGVPFRYATSLHPRLSGDLAPLALRLSPQEVTALETDPEPTEADGCSSVDDEASSLVPRRLYRCTCGTNTIHVSAWAELGTCTLEYEVRASLREHSVKEAIDKVFRKVRALDYETNTPCRDCSVYTFCNKKPTQARLEFRNPEAPIPYACDLAFLRASQTAGRPLIHPLKKGSSPI